MDDMGVVIEIARRALVTGLMVSGPLLAVGFVVGLVASALQTVTQIHETSLVFVVKMLAVAAAFFVFGPWMLATMAAFTYELLQAIPKLCA